MSGPFGATPWMYDHTDFYPLDINQSLKFNDDESQYLSWTPASAGDRKTFTYSTWLKRGKISSDNPTWGMTAGTLNNSSNPRTEMQFNPSSNIVIGFNASGASWNESTTNAVFRDPSAWYHLVVAVDMTQATSTDRLKLWVNNELQTWSSYSVPAQNTDLPINNTLLHAIGDYVAAVGGSYRHDGYLSDIHFIDGQALAPTNFGEFKESIWIPKVYNGTYGSNGFHLPFKNDDTVEGFNAVTYRGNGGTQSISGLGFEPDFVWMKQRNGTGYHTLFDTVRGATKNLSSNSTDPEATLSNHLTAFNGDGFTLGSNSDLNGSGNTYVGWAWDAGSGSPVSNTDGSITSTVKANPSYGFSIVSYTGNGGSGTVGHGLNSAPEMVIVKPRDISQGWSVWHNGLSGGTYYLSLNTTDAQFSASSVFVSSPSSTVINVGSDLSPASNLIAYCFHSVAGYSSIGSYTGNGSTSGPTVTTGFPVAFVMIKRTDAAGHNWVIMDNTRNPVNPAGKSLTPNTSSAEYDYTSGVFDFNSTGFQLKAADAWNNASGGTYIYMAFADTREAAFWKDVSGQNNHWTPNNLDYRDSVPDSTTNNFAVMNSIDVPSTGTLSEGNLKIAGANYLRRKANWHFGAGGIQSGKWYWEICNIGSSYGTDNGVIGSLTEAGGENFQVANKSYFRIGSIYKNYTATSYVSSGTSYTSGDVVGFALDLDSSPQTIKYYHNGTLVNTDTTISAAPVLVPFTSSTNGSWPDTYYNFGQDSTFAGAKPKGTYTDDNNIGNFQYAPPAGYLALCTANLPTPTIVDGSEYFNTVLWTGDGTSSRSFTGYNFAPDFLWAKQRSQAISHALYDSVRGAGANSELSSNSTAAEGGGNNDQFGYLSSFDSDGFTAVDGTSSPNYYFNENSQSFVGWGWKAGGTAVSNTDGSITSTVSANTDAGFSIVSYTAQSNGNDTVGHGLTQTPELVFWKARTKTEDWLVTSTLFANPSQQFLKLNLTDALNTVGTSSYSFTPTTVRASTRLDDTDSYIAYCFHSVENYSKVGSYTGNGSTDGPFVYTGFRPAWVMFKRTDVSGDYWYIIDSTRNPYNEADNNLYPNASDAEYGGTGDDGYDFLSNGFKVSNTYTGNNGSGGTIIYLAFAENPFKYSNAR